MDKPGTGEIKICLCGQVLVDKKRAATKVENIFPQT